MGKILTFLPFGILLATQLFGLPHVLGQGMTTTPPPITTIRSMTTMTPSTTTTERYLPVTPPYGITLYGNLSTTTGEDFSQSCLDAYNLEMRDRAVGMIGVVNERIGVSLCKSHTTSDIKMVSTTSAVFSNGSRAITDLMFFMVSSDRMCAENISTCAAEVSLYLQKHENWGYPILPTQPGCPPVDFFPNYFIDGGSDWYCLGLPNMNTEDSNKKAFDALDEIAAKAKEPAGTRDTRPPGNEIELYGNYTTESGENITPQCARAYTDYLEMEVFKMIGKLNNRIANQILCRNADVRVLTGTTTFTPFGPAGNTNVHYYLVHNDPPSNETCFSFEGLYDCADEITVHLCDHQNWQTPLLPQLSGCPFLVFNPEIFYAESKRWHCFQ